MNNIGKRVLALEHTRTANCELSFEPIPDTATLQQAAQMYQEKLKRMNEHHRNNPQLMARVREKFKSMAPEEIEEGARLYGMLINRI